MNDEHARAATLVHDTYYAAHGPGVRTRVRVRQDGTILVAVRYTCQRYTITEAGEYDSMDELVEHMERTKQIRSKVQLSLGV